MASIVGREELFKKVLGEEIALHRHLDDVAALQRQLPLGRVLDDDVFHKGPAGLSRHPPGG